jgi:uncharacterized protein YjbI with pentapeptide repeats
LFESGVRGTPVRLRFGAHLALVLVLAVVLAVGSGWLVWWGLGRPRLSPPKPGPLAPEDLYNGVKLALAVVAGVGGVVALVVAYRRQRFAEREHDRAEAAMDREATKLFTERFGKASEQLGSDKAAVRLAGVYALASLADDWEAGRQMCIDVLCAYLRMPYTPPVDQSKEPAGSADGNGEAAGDAAVVVDEEKQRERLQERQVRLTIIRVITAHLWEGAPVSWQGHDFDFSGAVFDGGDFSRAVFSGGSVDFSEAEFTGGNVGFSGTQFTGSNVYFSGTQFTGGNVDFIGTQFTGSNVYFSRTRFTGSNVDFSEAEFTGGNVYFIGTQFTGSNVYFIGTQFTGSNVYFSEAEFTGGEVDFRYAQFTGGNVDFIGTQFTGSNVDFSAARFTGGNVDFSAARFTGGRIDLQSAFFGTPPVFDSWADGPPESLLLPPDFRRDAGDADSDSAGSPDPE